MFRGSAGFEWNHVVWFNQSHITWSAGNKMAATIPRGIRRQLPLDVSASIIKLILLVLKNSTSSECNLYFEGIWNNYKNITILHARVYNSLNDPPLHYKVWCTNVIQTAPASAMHQCGYTLSPTQLICLLLFDDLHLQIIESISPKAYVENLSAQCVLLFFLIG